MRSKSQIFIKNPLQLACNMELAYGAIIAESYWRQTKSGTIEESQPVTSEILNGFFYPYRPTVKGVRVMINKLFTGFVIEEVIDAHNVHTERIVNKPSLDINDDPEFVRAQLNANFNEHYTAND